MGWRKRAREFQGNRFERAEESRHAGYRYCLYGQSGRFCCRNQCHIPKSDIQNCIIHQLRSSSKYISYKNVKEVMANPKTIHAAPDEQIAMVALNKFEEIREKIHPKIASS